MKDLIYAIPTNFQYGEAFKVREFEDEEKLKNFLRNVKHPHTYIIIEGHKLKAHRKEIIEIERPQDEVLEEE